MKKVLLSLLVLSGFSATAQTFTVDDTLYTGLSTDYFVMDSNAVNLDAVTGTGVTWNYSSLAAYTTTTIPDVIIDASASPFSSDFPTAAYNDDMSSGVSYFFSNSLDSMTVYGYVLSAAGNEVIVRHSDDPLKLLEFPMSVGDSYSDLIAGEVETGGFPLPSSGSATVTLDGSGTLQVSGNTHTNVIRVKLTETITGSITTPFPVSGTVTRTVYSYYDLANSKQPILVHGNVTLTSDALNDDYTAVYYAGTPNYYLGVGESSVETMSVYPNPASGVVTITTDGAADNLQVVNMLGEVVYTLNNPQATEQLDVSGFSKGIYMLVIHRDGVVTNQQLVIE